MTTLDRYILRGLIVNYVIAIAVMISMYVLLDVFFNMDEFTENAGSVLVNMASFYGSRVFLYFAQLSGVITLFACLITLARMRRQNELIAVLASGISLYRVAAPVVAFALTTSVLWYVDSEVVIPSIANKLARRHDDAMGRNTFSVRFLRAANNDLLSADRYVPDDEMLKRMAVLRRGPKGELLSIIEAEEARWEVDPALPEGGRWHLERGVERFRPDLADAAGRAERELVEYYETDLDPQSIETRQSSRWMHYLSTRRLTMLANSLEGEARRQADEQRYARFTTPLINLLMLFLGLPFILDRLPGSLLVAGGKALFTCGLCFLLTFMVQNFRAEGSLSTLPAWAPVILFTPVAVVLMDRLRT
ncbi:MAG TPA: LptF/LptG family permease [Phycisphaerae bacterium]|nr:LptF/LptG family permease [Phycisphaerales bacterium]HRX83455.1 LptF/LptG family permease [Phycisphaerae bacterium]